MARTNLAANVVRIPTKSTYRDLITAKFTEHDTALDAIMGDGLVDPTEAISANGALSTSLPLSLLTVSGTKAYSLADGTKVGQKKQIRCVSAASTPVGVVTAARAIAHTTGDNVVSATSTFTLANGNFTANDVGRKIVLGSTSGGTNNGSYVISSVTSPTVAVVSTSVPADETFGSGVTSSLRGLIDGTNGTLTFGAAEEFTTLIWTILGWRIYASGGSVSIG